MRIAAILSFFIMLTAFQCHRTCTEPVPGSLTGKWFYSEYLMDPGNGSGTWQPAPQGQTVEFKTDGTLASNAGLFGSYTNYEILSDSTLRFTSTTSGNPITMRYTLRATLLQINPQCIERCGHRFRRD